METAIRVSEFFKARGEDFKLAGSGWCIRRDFKGTLLFSGSGGEEKGIAYMTPSEEATVNSFFDAYDQL